MQPAIGNIVHFVRYLRHIGLTTAPETTGDLVEAARHVGLANRADVKVAFRSLVITERDDVEQFDEAFERFFGTHRPRGSYSVDGAMPPQEHLSLSLLGLNRSRTSATEEVSAQTGASLAERLGERDFGELDAEELSEVKRLIATMVWSPPAVRSRRWGPARRGERPHLRTTLRRMVGPTGDLMQLAMASRKPRPRPVIVIADISGSMERYSEMLLYFMHAAQSRLGPIEAFVFSTKLTRITRQIRHRDPQMAIRQVTGSVDDWSGGTNIGAALHSFNWDWSRRVAGRRPVALIISDGWDCGEPDTLRLEMARLHRGVHRVVWLNPLAGRPGFAPAARGMSAALPHVDHLLAAGTLDDLTAVVTLLESMTERAFEVA